MKRSKIKRREKMEGEHLSYFAIHNLLSIAVFFMITIRMGVFDIVDIELSYILSWSFAETIIWVFIISCIAEAFGRLVGYFAIIVPVSKYIYKRDYKSFRIINEGINRFSYKTIITLLLSSFLFSIGALYLISGLLFEENTLYVLILSYIIIKVGVYLILKFFIK